MDRTAPPSECHLEQFRLGGQFPNAPRLPASDSQLVDISRLPIRSLESIFPFTAPESTIGPFCLPQPELCVVLRSARYPCQSHQDPAWLPKDLTEPPSFTRTRSGSKHYAFKRLNHRYNCTHGKLPWTDLSGCFTALAAQLFPLSLPAPIVGYVSLSSVETLRRPLVCTLPLSTPQKLSLLLP